MSVFCYVLLILTSCSGFYNLGHRAGGDFIKAPENSLSCVKQALNKHQFHNHFVYLEIDVRETLDHQIIVFHDSSLKRLMKSAQTKHIIRFMTLNEIKEFRFQKNSSESIPTLDEFLTFIGDHNLIKPLVIEIKNIYSKQGMEKLCLAIEAYNHVYGALADIEYLTSFDFPKRPVTLMCLIGNFPAPVKYRKNYWKKRLSDSGVVGIYKPVQHKVKLF